MTRRLLISALPGERRTAWLQDGRLEDLIIERADRPSLLGNCYLGRVHQVDKALDAAFLDIGLEQAAFLPLGEAPGRRPAEGDLLAVRVISEPGGEKGPKVSARLPAALEELASRHKPAQPGLVKQAFDPVTQLSQAEVPPEEIVCDEPDLFGQLKAALAEKRPTLTDRLTLDRAPQPLFEREGVEAEIEALLEPQVALPSGGHLLIEPVETLTAIDVNSGAADRPAGRINQSALPVIARQLRLRALGGLIVIDFLPERAAEARKKLMADFKRALRGDPEPFRIIGLSHSGLLEMSRRRGRPPLHSLLTVPLESAVSVTAGRRLDPVHLAFQALRRLRCEALSAPGKRPTLRCAPDVARALAGPAAAARSQVETELGGMFELRSAADCPAYEILLEHPAFGPNAD